MPEIYASPGLKRIVKIALGLLAVVILITAVIANRAMSTQPPRMNYPTAQAAGVAFISKYESVHDTQSPAMRVWLIEEATLACSRLSNGLTLPQVWDAGTRDGMSSDMAATVVDAAIQVYCPQLRL